MDASSTILAELIPAITDGDIRMAERYLGVTFDTARRDILVSNGSFDVQACPGSGKTTLLVAKLAMLAEKWPHARRGMCVLSHTNVARREIETKLSGTAAGQRLLTYPHFVGTIHSFVNDFLALPLLRSEGLTVRLVDDEACFDWMKRRLTTWPTRGKLGNLAFKERTLDGFIWSLVCAGNPDDLTVPQGIGRDHWRVLTETKAKAVEQGLWYYDDMFAWAEKLLRQHPEVEQFARRRFPAVFLDEMQDTQELQGRLLAAVFPASLCGLRQRFGDSNQAIYDTGQRGASTEAFPSGDVRSIPNSQRFGASIAAKAGPLAPDPPRPSLVGEGPWRNLFAGAIDPSGMAHTIFLFGAKSAKQILPTFGAFLLQTLPDKVIRSDAFLARAIGRVGKAKEGGGDAPRHLGDYWEGYEPRAAKLEPRPHTLADYIHLAQRRRANSVDCAESVKTAIKGIIELVETIAPATAPSGGHAARWLRESLENDETAAREFRSCLWQWCVEVVLIAERHWPTQVEGLRKVIRPIVGEQWSKEAEAFCQWSADFAGPSHYDGSPTGTTPNRYRFTMGTRFVDIDVGTIHSAKGQTHTATLVVETFFKKHDLTDLLDWLVGSKCGAKHNEGIERLDRMRLVYTAMTRPTHLLCLAMRREAAGHGSELDSRIERLQSMGWRVQTL